MRHFLDDKENIYELLSGVNTNAPKGYNENAKACVLAYLGYSPVWGGATWVFDNRVLRTAFITRAKQVGLPDAPVAIVLEMPPTLENSVALITLLLVPTPLHNNDSQIIQITKALHGVDISCDNIRIAKRAVNRLRGKQ